MIPLVLTSLPGYFTGFYGIPLVLTSLSTDSHGSDVILAYVSRVLQDSTGFLMFLGVSHVSGELDEDYRLIWDTGCPTYRISQGTPVYTLSHDSSLEHQGKSGHGSTGISWDIGVQGVPGWVPGSSRWYPPCTWWLRHPLSVTHALKGHRLTSRGGTIPASVQHSKGTPSSTHRKHTMSSRYWTGFTGTLDQGELQGQGILHRKYRK